MLTSFRLGLFVVFTLLIFATGVFLIGNQQARFQSTFPVKANFHNVAGLTEGADVRVGGIHKGTVARIDLPHRPDQDVTVVMDLAKPTRDVIKADSVVSIRAEGLVGDKYVEISFGSPEAQPLRDGDILRSEQPVDIADLVKKTGQILDTTNDAVQYVETTANNLGSISSKIDRGVGTAGALINDKTAYNQVAAGATAFREDMDALKHNFLLHGFFTKRGYEDSDELTKHEISRLPSESYSKAFEYDAMKLFGKPDTAKLKNEKTLNEAGQFLQNQHFNLVVIESYTGPKGDSEQQRTLTEARDMVVRNYLVDNFRLDDTRIKTLGLGKAQDPSAGDGKLEILVYPDGTKTPAAQSSAASR
jgi:phospholipid/cholesterol/gamma-HCH transport system substrate-binding protein